MPCWWRLLPASVAAVTLSALDSMLTQHWSVSRCWLWMNHVDRGGLR